MFKRKKKCFKYKRKTEKKILALKYWIGFGRIILGRIHIQSKLKQKKLNNLKTEAHNGATVSVLSVYFKIHLETTVRIVHFGSFELSNTDNKRKP